MPSNTIQSSAPPETGTAIHAAPAPNGRKRYVRLTAVVIGLTAAITLMLCAFGLPSANGGPHQVPLGVTGPQSAVDSLKTQLPDDQWDVTAYPDTQALTRAVQDRDALGGFSMSTDGITVYTAAAGGQQATGALTALGDSLAQRQSVPVTVHEVVPFPDDDPKGTGLASAALPMVFGGILPAVVLLQLFPGHSGLRLRLAGVIAFALAAGAAVTAVLQFGIGTLDGNFWLTSLGMSLGMAALAIPFLGLESLFGYAGFGAGTVVMMFLGNPLSGLGTGPYWLPDGWSTLGQLLPPGASGSLLRANAFFDGAGAGGPLLVLALWALAGLALMGFADRRHGRRATA
ncbi:hypothetical protein [Streptomyces sp. NBC_01089]|uniref:hypothetical protein n=1 Tax=Streptomyces sp. NBC_01089 TaxID=2903747 RepID=UPI00386304D4